MPKASPAITSFNAGELSPLLGARFDIDKYANGAAKLLNFIPTVQGPLKKRAGTRYIGKTKNTKSLLISFEYSVDQTYVIELGAGYARFYTADATTGERGILLNASGQPVEVVTPYTLNDLFHTDGSTKIRYVQLADVVYICCPNHPVKLLRRVSATAFTFSDFEYKAGPFDDLNETGVTVSIGGDRAGGVAITASHAIFNTGHVGSWFYVESGDGVTVEPWEPDTSTYIGVERRSDGKNYIAQNTAYTGTSRPIHTAGIEIDGVVEAKLNPERFSGVRWLYTDPGYGYIKITEVISATRANGVVATGTLLPNGVMGKDTKRWAFGAWNRVQGFPTSVAFFKSRLWFARGQKVWGSVSNAFDDFAAKNFGQVTPDMAISITLSSGQINDIHWLLPDKDLIAGTAGGEFSIGELSNGDPLGPENVRITLQSEFGSKYIQPAKSGSNILFMQRAGLKAREMFYSMASDGYTANNATILSDHITSGEGLTLSGRKVFGVNAMASVEEPFPIVWMTRTDGKLIGFTWDNEQEVKGWHSHDVSGFIESITAIPSFQGGGEELWMCVKRTINGQDQHYIEVMESIFHDEDDAQEQYYVDCGLTYRGTKASVISGLNHLEGQTVAVLADGAVQKSQIVQSGKINIYPAASVVHVGLPYRAIYQSMNIEAGAADGTAQGKTKRIHNVVYRFRNTGECLYGPSLDRLKPFMFRTKTDKMDEAVPLFTGDERISFDDYYNTNGRVMIVSEKPFALTLIGIFPQLVTQDR